ncbi:Diacetyl reductase [(S)-acetoin forming] [Delftia tsuruhatensis]|nr:Diacetyl reductase [(S)-acetoin forming] [Delftia tsuruhatensis]
MQLQENMTALVTGGVSGLGEASALALLERGLNVVAVDLNEERGAAMVDAARQRHAGRLRFVRADVADADQMAEAIAAAEDFGEFRALVHCAGVGGPLRLVEKDGSPGSLDKYTHIVRVNLIGTFNTLRLAAASMARNDILDGERGACVLTASVAGYEGQIGQIPYASAKAGIIGMTLVAARDLATKMIRVCTIAPGLFDTPSWPGCPRTSASRWPRPCPTPRAWGRRPSTR